MQPNEPEEAVKAALYIRSLPGEPANSLERQLYALKRHVRANGLALARVYFETRDNGKSQFDAMTAEAVLEDPRFHQILAVEHVRFLLSKEELRRCMVRLEENGVRVVSITEPAWEPDS